MAAIAEDYLFATLVECVQRVQADFQAYYPQAGWTFALSTAQVSVFQGLRTVINDGTNVYTRTYAAFEIPQSVNVNLKWIMTQPGLVDISPAVMAPVSGIRTGTTEFTNKVLNPYIAALVTWGGGSSTVIADFVWGTSITGNTVTLMARRVTNQYVVGFITATVCTRDPATCTVLMPNAWTTTRGNVNMPATLQGSPAEAVLKRIADYLEQITTSRIDVTLNHGGQVYSATTQTAP